MEQRSVFCAKHRHWNITSWVQAIWRFFLLACLPGIASAQAQTVSPTVQVINLQPGQSINLPFRDAARFDFQLELKAGDYLLIRIANHDPAHQSGWGARVFRPDQKETFCFIQNSTREQLEGSVKTVTEVSGTHRLAIHWGGASDPAAHFTLSVLEWRTATASEVVRLQTVREARQIIDSYHQPTAEALRNIIAKGEKPAAILEELGEFEQAGQLHYYAGLAHHDLGEYGDALQCYQRARTLCQRDNNKLEEAIVVTTIGETFHKQSRFQEALDAYTQSIPLWEQCHPDLVGGGIGWALSNIGTVYAAMGESEFAMTYYQRALTEYEKLGLSSRERNRGIGTISAKMGQLQALAGNWTAALQHYRQAVAYLKKQEGPTFWGRFYARLGEAYAATGDAQTAEATMEEGVRIWQEAGDPYMQAGALTSLGKFYHQQGKLAAAATCLQQALELQRSLLSLRDQAETLYQLSQLERTRNEVKTAEGYVAQAIQLIEEVRIGLTDVEMRASFLATVQDYYALQLDLLMRLHRQAPQVGYNIAALQVSERARARSLLDLLQESQTDIRSGVDAKLLARERDLRQTLSDKSALLTQVLRNKETAPQAEIMRSELKLRQAEYEQTRAQIRATSPKYAALTQPQPLTLADIQRELDADTVLLEYALSEPASYLWVVSRHSFQSYELPGRTQLEPLARRIYELVTAHNRHVANETPTMREARLAQADREYGEAAEKLSQILFGPLQNQLPAKRLCIVADGVLHYVPFAALPAPLIRGGSQTAKPKTQNAQPLIAEYEIIQLPSATTLRALRQDKEKRDSQQQEVAIFADPVFDERDPRVRQKNPALVATITTHKQSDKLTQSLRSAGIAAEDGQIPRLLFTRREAEAISRLLPATAQLKALDFAASRRQALTAELSRYRILHFATHGLVDNANPALSGLLLSLINEQGRAQDGMLRLQDIYNLQLNAELVVISACQTALGQEVRGEGVMSLARGFLYAGSRRVISTLWKVDDRATAELMSEFYQETLGTQHRQAAAALRAAQLKLLKNPRWKSPRYWAAFIQQGDW